MSANRIKYRVVEEDVPGVTPAGDMHEVQLPGLAFQHQVQRGESAHVRTDRQPGDAPATGYTVSGSSTTDWNYRHGGTPALHRSVFCSAPIAPYSTTAATIEAINAGNILRNSAGWAGLTAGSFTLVSGFAVNPALFLAPIMAVNGNDAVVDPSFRVLQDEPAGAPITVYHDENNKLGVDVRTVTVERWDESSEKGEVVPGLIVNQWTLNVPYPNACTQAFGLTGFKDPVDIGAQLGNGTVAATPRPVYRSSIDFQDLVNPDVGFGFRYSGAILGGIEWTSLQLTLDNPVATRGGAGRFGPQRVETEGAFGVRLQVQFNRNEGDAEPDQLVADARDRDAVLSIGFGFLDRDGDRKYVYMPALQPEGVTTPGAAKTGPATASITYRASEPSSPDWPVLNMADFAALP